MKQIIVTENDYEIHQLATDIAFMFHWNTEESLQFCRELLETVNLHDEAAEVEKWLRDLESDVRSYAIQIASAKKYINERIETLKSVQREITDQKLKIKELEKQYQAAKFRLEGLR